ncbi:MAG: U32 family peptidase [Deferribacteres bacterium]|nr:U32 family peptidase [candidate division KSB1 bacterium]MCB9503613.1 U32 family peptidase [Deferribacteres bacterium]
MNQIELLSPARDLQCGITAINCGADAVYIGAPKFGARSKAGNSLHDIAELVRHAHIYWAKVYVVLNTILFDHELPEAVSLVRQLYEMGVDALIIQDMGLLECDLPPIPLNASTQMHNNSPEKVRFLEQSGFQRVILARELSIEQIREIRLQTNVELECFVHGALCVCYSGQCYMSYAIGGRSGNRGECAQPCRKRYRIVNQAGEQVQPFNHWLSLRDLNLSTHLADLIDAGISSFKIEGRLKDQTYVANVVGYYRQELDLVLAAKQLNAASSGQVEFDFEPDLDKTFNRGYTTYFIDGKGQSPGFPDTPKMVGEELGTVIKVERDHFIHDIKTELHSGDGICYFTSHGELQGTSINQADGQRIFPAEMKEIQAGTVIYRNYDHVFLKALANNRTRRTIGVTITVSDTAEGIRLTACDEEEICAQLDYTLEKIPARNAGAVQTKLVEALSRSGDTPFRIDKVDILWESMWFIPVSMLNEWRRTLLNELLARREGARPKRAFPRAGADNPTYPISKLDFRGNVLNSHARDFYMHHGVEQIDPAAESGKDLHGEAVMRTRYCIKHQLGLCDTKHPKHQSTEPWFLEDEQKRRFRIQFDCRPCEMVLVWEKG